jgi:hypothetical protein
MWGKKEEPMGTVKVLFQARSDRTANGTVFFGQLHDFPRMSEDDALAYSALLKRHFPNVAVAWWPRESPDAIQSILRDWCRDQALDLVSVAEYERSDGYFQWRIEYAIPHARWV